MGNLLTIEFKENAKTVFENGLTDTAKGLIKKLTMDFSLTKAQESALNAIREAYKRKAVMTEGEKTALQSGLDINLQELVSKIVVTIDNLYARDLTVPELVDLGKFIQISMNSVKSSIGKSDMFLGLFISQAIASGVEQDKLENSIMDAVSETLNEQNTKSN